MILFASANALLANGESTLIPTIWALMRAHHRHRIAERAHLFRADAREGAGIERQDGLLSKKLAEVALLLLGVVQGECWGLVADFECHGWMSFADG